MPINQIPFSNLHKNFTISGVTNANARVMLFNPNENRYVKAVDADENGNYNFGNINSSVPLQIKLASSNYFNCISTSEIVEPAVTINTLKGKCILTVVDMYSLNRSGYLWVGAPKVIFVDQNGNGTGASMNINLASVGQTHFDGFGFQPFEANDPLGNPITGMSPILNFSMTNFGSNYNNPICFIRGVRGNANFNYETESYDSEFVSVQLSVTTVGSVGVIQDENDFLSNVATRYGQSNTWGNFGGQNNTGQRLLVQIPGYSNINYNISCDTEDDTEPGPVLQEKIVEIMAATLNPKSDDVWLSAEFQLYLAIIHGFDYSIYGDYVVTGQPRSFDNTIPNNNFSNSAFTLQSNGRIFAAELEYLKGWLAQAVQVNAMVNKANSDFLIWKTDNTAILTATGYLNTGLNTLLGLAGETIHQLGDVIKRYNDDNAHNSWNSLPAIVGYDVSFQSRSFPEVFWQEWQQSKLRVPAIIDAATGDTKTIKKILNKMSDVNNNYLTGIRTNDSTGTYRWDFSGDTLQKIQVN
jgi:hypothetical protein